MDAYRNAARESWKANEDILGGWQWVAELGPRTCRACVALHGQIFPLSERGPDDHPNGRCTGAPVTKTWAELGFRDIPETRMEIGAGAGENWLRRQPLNVQQHILGQRGQAAWAAGQWPSTEWAAHKDSTTWRGYFTQANQPKSVEVTWREGDQGRKIPVLQVHTITNHQGKTVTLYQVDKRYAQQMSKDLSTVYQESAFGKQVTPFTEEELKEFSRLYVSEDGLAGVGIRPSGEIGALYSNNAMKGSGDSLVRLALQEGGEYLECFDTYLPGVYSRAGLGKIAEIPFNPEFAPDGWDYQKMKDYNQGLPDVIFMVRDRPGLVVRRFDDYDAAESYTRANLG